MMSGMDRIALALGLLLSVGTAGCIHRSGRVPVEGASVASEPVTEAPLPETRTVTERFETEVQPILATHCQPCHFPGGSMHERLPFDRAETIVTLGERLLSRIDDEEERRVIREYLEGVAAETAGDAS